ncbi:acetylornithine deacetylase [Salipiger mucosus]|uniref:Acetylornithine deacetylase n=1 Tax=Salipiger mucosus DSM 16094 TaxID=1123237 RepID=S9Q5L0_9RHOB|nr:acetylornithine deacetylase [Salipiger mucosus]EPX76626.1 Acetylornithine deacetylase [Salipiger mucosus DSM 16094]
MTTHFTPAAMLERLVAHATVVGTPNGALVDFVADYLEAHGARVQVLPGPEGDRSNLFATIGPEDRRGLILSGHLDVVPAEEPGWQADPFVLRAEAGRLIGRGACDMKGFVAAVLAAVPAMAETQLETPLHIALSYDEEAGCRGVGHMIDRLPELCPPPLGCIVGEPTGLAPVLSHKGKAAVRLVARGIAGHSARPDLGRNAIHALLPALARVAEEAARLTAEGPFDDGFAPPHHTMQVGTMSGGEALNVLPDHAEARIEARVLPGADPLEVLRPVLDLVAATEHVEAEILAAYPPLAQEAEVPLVRLVEGISGNAAQSAVSFGTEAGLFRAAGMPAVLCRAGRHGARPQTRGIHPRKRTRGRARDDPRADPAACRRRRRGAPHAVAARALARIGGQSSPVLGCQVVPSGPLSGARSSSNSYMSGR